MKYLLFIAAVASFFVVLNKDLRQEIYSFLQGQQQVEVLASASADLLNEGKIIKVLKVRKEQRLFVEIYSTENNGKPPLIQSIPLPDKSDGYFHFRGQATNLALEDLNGDQKLELLAPSFDVNMVAHLNIYTYNDITQQYERADPNDFPVKEEQ